MLYERTFKYLTMFGTFPYGLVLGMGTFAYVLYVMCILKTQSLSYTRIILIVTCILIVILTYILCITLIVISYILYVILILFIILSVWKVRGFAVRFLVEGVWIPYVCPMVL